MLLPDDLEEFLNIEPREQGSAELLFSTTKAYLRSIETAGYATQYTNYLRGIVTHYLRSLNVPESTAIQNGLLEPTKSIGEIDHEPLSIARASEHISDFQEALLQLTKRTSSKRKSPISDTLLGALLSGRSEEGTLFAPEIKAELDNRLAKIHSDVIEAYGRRDAFQERFEGLSLGGFFQPSTSNKAKATQLILEAIKYVKEDGLLSEKTKKEIIVHLETAISELESPTSSGTAIFGKIKEAVCILGALGSLAGGVTGVLALNQAKAKLEEASQVIEDTSININYQTTCNIFQSEVNLEIKSGNLLVEPATPKLLAPAQTIELESNPQVNRENEGNTEDKSTQDQS
ncbi:MAG: hypothetical protein AAFR18_11850 [Cyanobacteria bacterium J06627_32]